MVMMLIVDRKSETKRNFFAAKKHCWRVADRMIGVKMSRLSLGRLEAGDWLVHCYTGFARFFLNSTECVVATLRPLPLGSFELFEGEGVRFLAVDNVNSCGGDRPGCRA